MPPVTRRRQANAHGVPSYSLLANSEDTASAGRWGHAFGVVTGCWEGLLLGEAAWCWVSYKVRLGCTIGRLRYAPVRSGDSYKGALDRGSVGRTGGSSGPDKPNAGDVVMLGVH